MKKYSRIPLVKLKLSQSDIDPVIDVIKSGMLVNGPVVESFERQLSSFLDVRYAVCLSSGTAALHLGLLALGIGRGDEVIVPAFSYPASANAVEICGGRAVFVDSASDDFNIDDTLIENSLTPNTRAIMIVHNFGRPCEMTALRTISAKYNIPIIEDAACALGSSISGETCGSLGRLAAFSFHPRKILTTGEGGAVVTDDPLIAEKIRQFRNHGQALGKGIEFVSPGFNYRMGEMQAALGVSQMKRFKNVLRERRNAARYYDDAISKIGYLKIPSNTTRKSNYQTYIALVADSHRDDLIEHLKNNNIEAGIGTYSIPHTAYYAEKYRVTRSDYPNSYGYYKNLISLPLYEGITREEQDSVIESLKNFSPVGKSSKEQAQADTVEVAK